MSSSSSSSPATSPKRKTARSIYLAELKEEYTGASNRRFADLGNDVILTSAIINQITEAWNQGGKYVSSDKNRRMVFRFVDDNGDEKEYTIDYKWMSALPDVMTRAIKKMVDVHVISRKRRGQNGDMVLGRKVPHFVHGEVLKPLVRKIGLKLPQLEAGYATRFSVSMLITSYISASKLHDQRNGQIIKTDKNLKAILQSQAYAYYSGESKVFGALDDRSPVIFDVINATAKATIPYLDFMVILDILHKFKDREGHGVNDSDFARIKAEAKSMIGDTQQQTADNLSAMYTDYSNMLKQRYYTEDNAGRYAEYRAKAQKTRDSRDFSMDHFPFSSVATINSMLVASRKLLESTKGGSDVDAIVNYLGQQGAIDDMLDEERQIDVRHKELKAESEAAKLKSPKTKKKAVRKTTLGSMIKYSKR